MLKGKKVCVDVHWNINGSCLFVCWHFGQLLKLFQGFSGGPVVKNLPANVGDTRDLGFWIRKIPWRRKWHPSLIILLENPMDRGAWQGAVQSVGLQSWTWLSTHMLKLFLCDFFLISICFTVGENIFKLILCF